MRIGIIGHGAEKFTADSRARTYETIRRILLKTGATVVVSGHSPMGGVDIWAEEIGTGLELQLDIKVPTTHKWDAGYGYKARNLDIARCCDSVYVLVVDSYPPEYHGLRFPRCYHCDSTDHVKSGACWTARQALAMGKTAFWIVIPQIGLLGTGEPD